jgi:mitochondrial chaperone BCS1
LPTRRLICAQLNAMDGACGPIGHVALITTKHTEHLDSALIRPRGRIYVQIKLGLAVREQIKSLFEKFQRPTSKN